MSPEQAIDAINDYAAAFDRILKLHRPRNGRPLQCFHCLKAWPCPTVDLAIAARTPT